MQTLEKRPLSVSSEWIERMELLQIYADPFNLWLLCVAVEGLQACGEAWVEVYRQGEVSN